MGLLYYGNIVKKFSSSYDMGICVQAYLRRTKNDFNDLSECNGKVRIVKGVYNEDNEIAFQSSEK